LRKITHNEQLRVKFLDNQQCVNYQDCANRPVPYIDDGIKGHFIGEEGRLDDYRKYLKQKGYPDSAWQTFFNEDCQRQGYCTSPLPVEDYIDYKDIETLERLVTNRGKIYSRKRSGNCAGCQRKVQGAIKRARHMALLPFTA